MRFPQPVVTRSTSQQQIDRDTAVFAQRTSSSSFWAWPEHIDSTEWHAAAPTRATGQGGFCHVEEQPWPTLVLLGGQPNSKEKQGDSRIPQRHQRHRHQFAQLRRTSMHELCCVADDNSEYSSTVPWDTGSGSSAAVWLWHPQSFLQALLRGRRQFQRPQSRAQERQSRPRRTCPLTMRARTDFPPTPVTASTSRHLAFSRCSNSRRQANSFGRHFGGNDGAECSCFFDLLVGVVRFPLRVVRRDHVRAPYVTSINIGGVGFVQGWQGQVLLSARVQGEGDAHQGRIAVARRLRTGRPQGHHLGPPGGEGGGGASRATWTRQSRSQVTSLTFQVHRLARSTFSLWVFVFFLCVRLMSLSLLPVASRPIPRRAVFRCNRRSHFQLQLSHQRASCEHLSIPRYGCATRFSRCSFRTLFPSSTGRAVDKAVVVQQLSHTDVFTRAKSCNFCSAPRLVRFQDVFWGC